MNKYPILERVTELASAVKACKDSVDYVLHKEEGYKHMTMLAESRKVMEKLSLEEDFPQDKVGALKERVNEDIRHEYQRILQDDELGPVAGLVDYLTDVEKVLKEVLLAMKDHPDLDRMTGEKFDNIPAGKGETVCVVPYCKRLTDGSTYCVDCEERKNSVVEAALTAFAESLPMPAVEGKNACATEGCPRLTGAFPFCQYCSPRQNVPDIPHYLHVCEGKGCNRYTEWTICLYCHHTAKYGAHDCKILTCPHRCEIYECDDPATREKCKACEGILFCRGEACSNLTRDGFCEACRRQQVVKVCKKTGCKKLTKFELCRDCHFNAEFGKPQNKRTFHVCETSGCEKFTEWEYCDACHEKAMKEGE